MLINELLGIRYPIFQGAMANIATAEFAAAVSNCGGLGIIATGAMDEVQTRAAIKKCKQLTKQPLSLIHILREEHSLGMRKSWSVYKKRLVYMKQWLPVRQN